MSQTGSSVADLLNSILSHKEEPGYAYGSLWPTRYKVDAQGNPVHGTLSFDPGAGALGNTVRAAHDLLVTPGQVASGQVKATPETGARLAGDMFSLGTGVGRLGGPTGASVAGMFTGPGARTWTQLSVDEAEHMEDSGAHPETIWQNTGLFRGGDGQWRGEVPDTGAKINTDRLIEHPYMKGQYYVRGTDQLKLGDVLQHPNLYREYPDLAERPIGLVPLLDSMNGTHAQYDPDLKQINLFGGRTADILSSTLHETQHAIDHLEGRQYGANTLQFIPKSVQGMMSELPGEKQALAERMHKEGRPGQLPQDIDPDETDNYINQLHSIMRKQGQGLSGPDHAAIQAISHEPWLDDFLDYSAKRMAVDSAKRTAFDMYRRTGGEVMARNVQNRLKGFQPDLFKDFERDMLVRDSHGELMRVDPESFNHGYFSPMRTEDETRSLQIWHPQGKYAGSASAEPPTGGEPGFRTNPFRLADEHQQDVTRLETEAYKGAGQARGGALPNNYGQKPALQLFSGGADSHNGDFPTLVRDGQTGKYHGIFPGMDEARDYIGSGPYNPSLHTTMSTPKEQETLTRDFLNRRQLSDSDKYTLAQERQKTGGVEGRQQYRAAAQQQAVERANANLSSLDRATVPSYGINYTVQRLPTGIVKVSHPDGHAWLYDAKTGAMRGGDSQGGHTMAALGALNQFLQRSK